MSKEEHGSLAWLMNEYVQDMIVHMLDARLNEIASKPDAPFAAAGVDFSDYIVAKTKDAFAAYVLAKGTDIVEPLQAVYREILRAQRGGFTVGEYQRAKDDYLSNLEKTFNNRATTENDKYVREYVRHFLDGNAMPGIETEWQIMQMVANQIPVEMINQAFAEVITPDNRAIMILSPEKEGYTLPVKDQVETALASIDGETIEGFVDEVKEEPLVPAAPVAGKIVNVTENPLYGTIEWTLSNG
ncbi:MAG: insulinase family protein, partial [Duncaniella sp.]|nr:insulinase family protein [Duncaniella sp.]